MLKPGLLRFILALTVIFFHISKLIFLGHFAVLCFFMLSGYWITFMYKNKYQKFEDVFKVFYISRVWRLFPVFLLFNILVFAVSYIYNPHFFDFFLAFKTSEKLGYGLSNIFLLGFYQFKNQILVPAWSLDIEMQFYLIYPFLFFLLSKLNYWLIIFFLIVTVALSLYFADTAIARTSLFYLFYFLTGVYICLKNIQFNKKTEIFTIFLFALVLIINYSLPGLKKLTVGDNTTGYNTHLNELLPLLVLPLICNSVKNKSTKTDRVLGDMSFVLYLCHWVLIIPYNFYTRGFTVLHRIPYSCGYLVTTLAISYLIYKFYDKPIDSLRREWVNVQRLRNV